MGGDAQHQAGRRRGQQDQNALLAPRDRGADGQRGGLGRILNPATPDSHGQTDHQQDEQSVSP
ncbi:hypothetical protein D3C72_455380 [compost metagenome]